MADLVPSLRLKLYLEKVPAAIGTDVYRWSTSALADPEFTEGRIVLNSWGEVEQALSTPDGHYEGGSFVFEINDDDGLIAGLFGSTETEFLVNREAALELLSTQGRILNLPWRPVIHGRISQMNPSARGRVRGELRDLLAADFASLSLDRGFGRVFIGDEHFNCPKDIKGRMYPIIVGEHSDEGTVDLNGEDAAEGAVPLIFVGMVMLNADGSLAPPGSESMIAYMQPPQNLQAQVIGTPGTRALTFSVSAIVNGYGETRQSNIVQVPNAPNTLSGSNFVRLTWDLPVQYGEYVSSWRIMGRSALTSPTRHLAVIDNTGLRTYDDTGTASEKLPVAPRYGTAQGQVLINGVYASGWGKMLIGLGAVRHHALFGSNLGDNQVPPAPEERIRLPENHPDVARPFLDSGAVNPAWPLPNTWIEDWGGIRATYVGVKGPLLQSHLEGRVTLAANVCGYTEDGDQPGPIVDEPGEAFKLSINEFILKNSGEGYRNGPFGPLQTFTNGTPVLKTSTFESVDAITATIKDGGYKAAWYISDNSYTLREFLRDWCQTFGTFVGSDDYGQIVAAIIDPYLQVNTCQRYREHVEILDGEFPRAVQEMQYTQSKRTYRWHWLPDKQDWRNAAVTLTDEQARTALKASHRDSGEIGLRCTNDRETAEHAQARILNFRRWPLIFQSWTVGMMGAEQRLGQVALLCHSEGGGRGPYNARPFFIVSKRFNPNTSTYTLTGIDVVRMLGLGTPEPGFPEDAIGEIDVFIDPLTDTSSFTVESATTI